MFYISTFALWTLRSLDQDTHFKIFDMQIMFPTENVLIHFFEKKMQVKVYVDQRYNYAELYKYVYI
jgi:hypothetical protein